MDQLPTAALDGLASYLPLASLYSLSLGCKRLLAVAQAPLYRSIDIDTTNAARTLRLLKTLGNSPHYGALVKQLHVVQFNITSPEFAPVVAEGDLVTRAIKNLVNMQRLRCEESVHFMLLVVLSGAHFHALQACALPYFGPEVGDFVEKHALSLRCLRVHSSDKLLARRRAGEESLKTLSLPRLEAFTGPPLLAVLWLRDSPLVHVVFLSYDRSKDVSLTKAALQSLDSTKLVSCSIHYEVSAGRDTAFLPALAAHTPTVRCVALDQGGLSDDEYTTLLASVAPSLPLLNCLASLDLLGMFPAEPLPNKDVPLATLRPALLAELATVQHWGRLCVTLDHVRLRNGWDWVRADPEMWFLPNGLGAGHQCGGPSYIAVTEMLLDDECNDAGITVLGEAGEDIMMAARVKMRERMQAVEEMREEALDGLLDREKPWFMPVWVFLVDYLLVPLFWSLVLDLLGKYM